MAFITILSKSKNYIAGAGLLGLALYQASQSEFSQAGTSLMAAIAAFGLGKSPAPTVVAK